MTIVLAHRGSAGIPYGTASEHLAAAISELSAKSVTAKGIIEFVQRSAVEINIVVTQQPGAFGPYCEPFGFEGPCILWDPTSPFSTRATDITGYRANGTAMFGKKTVTSYPASIVLIHELGHAKQYIEDKTLFCTKTTPARESTDFVEADNLKRHENPVCKDMGLLQRVKYNDFV